MTQVCGSKAWVMEKQGVHFVVSIKAELMTTLWVSNSIPRHIIHTTHTSTNGHTCAHTNTYMHTPYTHTKNLMMAQSWKETVQTQERE